MKEQTKKLFVWTTIGLGCIALEMMFVFWLIGYLVNP